MNMLEFGFKYTEDSLLLSSLGCVIITLDVGSW